MYGVGESFILKLNRARKYCNLLFMENMTDCYVLRFYKMNEGFMKKSIGFERGMPNVKDEKNQSILM